MKLHFRFLVIMATLLSIKVGFSEDHPSPRLDDCFLKVLGSYELVELKYDPSVALRLSALRPDVVREILSRSTAGDPLTDPVTVYRGLPIDPSDFEPNWENAGRLPPSTALEFKAGEIWVSKNLDIPLEWSGRISSDLPISSQRYKTIIEYQVPKFLLVDVFGNIITNQLTGLLQAKTIPDSRPFIKRIGVVDAENYIKNEGRNKLSPEDVYWFDYDSVFQNGVPRNPLTLDVVPLSHEVQKNVDLIKKLTKISRATEGGLPYVTIRTFKRYVHEFITKIKTVFLNTPTGLIEKTFTISGGYGSDVSTLGSKGHIMDLGAGILFHVWELLRSQMTLEEARNLTAQKKYIEYPDAFDVLSYPLNERPNITAITLCRGSFRSHSKMNLIQDRFFEDIPVEELLKFGEVDIAADDYGILAYTTDVSMTLTKIHRVLKTGGRLYVRRANHTFEYRNGTLTFREFLVKIGFKQIGPDVFKKTESPLQIPRMRLIEIKANGPVESVYQVLPDL